MREDTVALVSLELIKRFSAVIYIGGVSFSSNLVPPYVNISPARFELYWILLSYIHRLNFTSNLEWWIIYVHKHWSKLNFENIIFLIMFILTWSIFQNKTSVVITFVIFLVLIYFRYSYLENNIYIYVKFIYLTLFIIHKIFLY